jgi:transposase
VEETDEAVELVERVAALDIGKATLTCCIRIPHEENPARRRQEVDEYPTTTRSLLGMADRLRSHGVTLVAMEATSDYWKPAFYLLEAEGFECWLLNAKHVKNVPGRPKTDKLDAVWLAKVVERGMCRPSFVPPKPIRQLRDLTRYRRTLIREQTREKQRLEKILEDAQIKLSATVSDVFGVSGRQMIEAMIAGQRDPKVLAQMARGPMRAKISKLQEALTGHFEDHHGFICQMMLERIDELLSGDLADAADLIELGDLVGERGDHQVDPAAQLLDLGGELIAEIGVDMTVFPSAAHLVSWAKFAPQARQSVGKAKSASTGQGNPWLGGTLGEIVAAASRTNTFLAARYRRLIKHRGKGRAIVAIGNSVLTIVWHLLADPQARYHDLGPDFYESRINQQRHQRNLIHQLERLTGQKVILQPRPEQPAA